MQETNFEEFKETVTDLFTSEITPTDLAYWLARANLVVARSEKITGDEKEVAEYLLFGLSNFLPAYMQGKNLSEYFFEVLDVRGYESLKKAVSYIGMAFYENYANREYHRRESENFVKILKKLIQVNEIYDDYEGASDKEQWVEANFSSL